MAHVGLAHSTFALANKHPAYDSETNPARFNCTMYIIKRTIQGGVALTRSGGRSQIFAAGFWDDPPLPPSLSRDGFITFSGLIANHT